MDKQDVGQHALGREGKKGLTYHPVPPVLLSVRRMPKVPGSQKNPALKGRWSVGRNPVVFSLAIKRRKSSFWPLLRLTLSFCFHF